MSGLNAHLGEDIGHARPVCGFGSRAAHCGQPAVWHVAVPEDDRAVTTLDGSPENTIFDLGYCCYLYVCDDHSDYVAAHFRWRVAHPVCDVCPHPEAEFREDACVLPESGLTTEALAAEMADTVS